MSKMNIFVVLIAIFVTIFLSCSLTSIIQKPTINELFDTLAVELESSQPRVYAFTDRVGGFWEGQTFAYNSNGGYNIGGKVVLRDFLTMLNDELLDRRSASKSIILPHKIEHIYEDNVTESISVLSGAKGMIVTLSNPENAEFSFFPIFTRNDLTFEIMENVLFFADSDGKSIGAISGSPYSIWVEHETGGEFDPNNPFSGFAAPYRLTEETVQELDVVVLFGTERSSLNNRIKEVLLDPASHIEDQKQQIGSMLLESYFKTNDPHFNKALHWAKISGNDLVVQQYGKGIWAGLPWFNQSWGRDTFIALPGVSLVTGQFEDARDIIRSFSEFQITDINNPDYGRVPNRVNSPDDIIYNTTDGTPWLIREIAEYVMYTGDVEFAREMYPVIERAIEGTLKYFLDKHGFMTHDDADTWMDARIRGDHPWSPRGNRAVEIQTLWYNQLVVSVYIAKLLGEEEKIEKWVQLAEKVKVNFNRDFLNETSNSLFDHINSDGSPDKMIRPNQMFALTIPLLSPLVSDEIAVGVMHEVVTKLTYPYGVASLFQDDQYFHPYHHDQVFHFDAAYHNGLCWQWNLGAVVGGMTQLGYIDKAYEITSNLSDQILNMGMPGSMSELVLPGKDDDGSLHLSGTYSQAWSVSEFVRNFYQDYLGIDVNMVERKLTVSPRLPKALDQIEFLMKIGQDELIEAEFLSDEKGLKYRFIGNNLTEPVTIYFEYMSHNFDLYETEFELKPNQEIELSVKDMWRMKKIGVEAMLNKNDIEMRKINTVERAPFIDLQFQIFKLNPELKSIIIPNYLENIILKKK